MALEGSTLASQATVEPDTLLKYLTPPADSRLALSRHKVPILLEWTLPFDSAQQPANRRRRPGKRRRPRGRRAAELVAPDASKASAKVTAHTAVMGCGLLTR